MTSTAPAVRQGISAMVARARAGTGPETRTVSPDRTVAVVTLPLPGNGTDRDVGRRARQPCAASVIPATIGRVAGTETGVERRHGEVDRLQRRHEGAAADRDRVRARRWRSCCCSSRSGRIVIPVTAIVLNLLSVGAAYGVVKLIFQDGNLESVLGFRSIGGVISWLPLFLFVVLFGLSMDYHVFILTRIREAVDGGMTHEQAVSHAIKSTAGVVTSAAVVMVAVFSIFATLGMIEFKQFGVALAVAVLLDATVVRGVLLPAAMKLLGPWNWYAPRWSVSRPRRRARAV